MKNGRLVSLKMVADRLQRNPVMSDINWETVIDFAVICMRKIGMPAIYINQSTEIDIVNYKGSIPFDLMYVVQAHVVIEGKLMPIVNGQDTLHDHFKCYPNETDRTEGLTYNLNNSKIFTNFESGKVVLAYKAIATDEHCYPMVLDDEKVLGAIEAYIKFRWFDILNDMEKISDRKLNKAETEYSWLMGQAQAGLSMPTIDEMEALTNQITQILPSRLQHADRFKFLGNQEYLKIQ